MVISLYRNNYFLVCTILKIKRAINMILSKKAFNVQDINRDSFFNVFTSLIIYIMYLFRNYFL